VRNPENKILKHKAAKPNIHKHKTLKHKTLKHKSPKHKSPKHKALKHKSPKHKIPETWTHNHFGLKPKDRQAALQTPFFPVFTWRTGVD
jgi:hypothetical protein